MPSWFKQLAFTRITALYSNRDHSHRRDVLQITCHFDWVALVTMGLDRFAGFPTRRRCVWGFRRRRPLLAAQQRPEPNPRNSLLVFASRRIIDQPKITSMDAHEAGASRIDCASGGEWMDRMRFGIVAAAVIAIFGMAHVAVSAKGSAAAQQNEKINHTNLKAGDMAPDFTLLDNNWKKIHLADYRGKKNVVLAFYVLAFTGG